MITPELIGYIRAEFAKGRTREEIRKVLVADGGWTEADLNEAFRTVTPMQSSAPNSVGYAGSATAKTQLVTPSSSSWSISKIILGVVILAVLVFGAWFYRAPLINFLNLGMDKITGLLSSYFGQETSSETEDTVATTPTTPPPSANTFAIKDCGIGTAPDMKNPLSYENDAVLACLGNSASSCENAKGILKDDLFPTIFEVSKWVDTCNFKLSYGADSNLIDITGKKLALQYISCPVSIVKAVDESKQVPVFSDPSTENSSKYAAQIYFYGTLGVFMENNVEKDKIKNLGCSGPFIDSVIASYRRTGSQ